MTKIKVIKKLDFVMQCITCFNIVFGGKELLDYVIIFSTCLVDAPTIELFVKEVNDLLTLGLLAVQLHI